MPIWGEETRPGHAILMSVPGGWSPNHERWGFCGLFTVSIFPIQDIQDTVSLKAMFHAAQCQFHPTVQC